MSRAHEHGCVKNVSECQRTNFTSISVAFSVLSLYSLRLVYSKAVANSSKKSKFNLLQKKN